MLLVDIVRKVENGTMFLNAFFSKFFIPNEKNLNCSKLKAFADDKINMTEKLKFVLGRVENIVGKGENAGYQHFLLFSQCFLKVSYSGSLKVVIVWERVKTLDFVV